MTWKEYIRELIVEHCNNQGSRTFSLHAFYDAHKQEIEEFRSDNHFPEEKVRQQLQYLRNEGFISFIDNSGHYTLRGIEILEDEVSDSRIVEIASETPEKREYLIETYARERGWVVQARETFGHDCMVPACRNTFKKENGQPYIEVHHIIPLCEGGEDGIWNLSVVCAHHHKMAHFANLQLKNDLSKLLRDETTKRIST